MNQKKQRIEKKMKSDKHRAHNTHNNSKIKGCNCWLVILYIERWYTFDKNKSIVSHIFLQFGVRIYYILA